ncbi:MAG: insulinase family protein [Anaerolineae bacterium]|nr:insulinase family protein [Anaerolineae bacterium]
MYRRKSKQLSLPGPDDTLRQTLPNGVTLLVRENFASPAVVVSGYVEAGGEDEGQAHGLAGFAVDVMERGTQSRSFEQLYEEVESIGASFGFSGGNHITSFGAKGLAEHLPLLLNILNDILRNPAFLPDQVEKTRAEIFTDLQELENDTYQKASQIFHELVYPETHPYHWNPLGYPETIGKITRDDLAQFHERYFAPQGATLVVVGAVKTQEAVQAIGDIFGNWEHTRPARDALTPVPALAERRERRITLNDKTQSDLIMGWPGPPREHPDFIPCYVANHILGVFGMYGRLGQRVRIQNSLAYYAQSKLDGGKGPGSWHISAGINPANVDKALALIQEEVRRFRDQQVSREELEDTQSYLTGVVPLQLETNEGVARALINIERYRLGMDYLQKYIEIIQTVNRGQVQTMAQRWLDIEHFALAIAGP